MKHYICLLLVCGLLFSCVDEKQKTNVLFPNMEMPHKEVCTENTKRTDLSDIFKDYKLIPLQTRGNCLLDGQSPKIIKKFNKFFIKSINEILIFNSNGIFLKKLSQCGLGPHEYIEISDFDVVELDNSKEIWIASELRILRYNIDSLTYIDEIPLSFFVNTLKYIDNGNIIVSSPDDKVFKIIDISGDIKKTFFDKNTAITGVKPVNFIKINNNIISQLSNSNDAVCYSINDKKFAMIKILQNSGNIETIDIDKKFYQKLGYLKQNPMIWKNYVIISSFRIVGNQSIIILRYPDDSWYMCTSNGETVNSYCYFPEHCSTINNNISPQSLNKFYNTMICGESEDSFLFIVNSPSKDNKNPKILEVFSLA